MVTGSSCSSGSSGTNHRQPAVTAIDLEASDSDGVGDGQDGLERPDDDGDEDEEEQLRRDRLSRLLGSKNVESLAKQFGKTSVHGRNEQTKLEDEKLHARRVVLDVTALLFGASVLKRWARSGEVSEWLLPEEVLASLDIVKRADRPLAALAREATRWIEKQLGLPPPHPPHPPHNGSHDFHGRRGGRGWHAHRGRPSTSPRHPPHRGRHSPPPQHHWHGRSEHSHTVHENRNEPYNVNVFQGEVDTNGGKTNSRALIDITDRQIKNQRESQDPHQTGFRIIGQAERLSWEDTVKCARLTHDDAYANDNSRAHGSIGDELEKAICLPRRGTLQCALHALQMETNSEKSLERKDRLEIVYANVPSYFADHPILVAARLLPPYSPKFFTSSQADGAQESPASSDTLRKFGEVITHFFSDDLAACLREITPAEAEEADEWEYLQRHGHDIRLEDWGHFGPPAHHHPPPHHHPHPHHRGHHHFHPPPFPPHHLYDAPPPHHYHPPPPPPTHPDWHHHGRERGNWHDRGHRGGGFAGPGRSHSPLCWDHPTHPPSPPHHRWHPPPPPHADFPPAAGPPGAHHSWTLPPHVRYPSPPSFGGY